jgi:hypothetical protein
MNKQYDKYANILIRTIKKYIFLKEKEYNSNTGLGKWLIICNNNVESEQLLFLGNIIGVTGWKIHQDKNNIYSKDTCCICIYCGINEKILSSEKQYKWILNVGNKLLKSKFLSQISIRNSIYFKENLKTRNNIYSHNSNNVSTLKLDFKKNIIYFVDELERHYPTKKKEKLYPFRYDNSIFKKFNEMNTIEMQNDFKKWKTGINYKTNRKITIGGKIHNELKQKFMINYRFRHILFEDLTNINIHQYLQETKKINNDIDIENISIKDYNKLVDDIIRRIQTLEKWNDFIEFEGTKYGIPKIYNNIHYENDCKGNINKTKVCSFECRQCRGSTSFNEHCTCEYKELIKCLKCGYV